MLGPGQILRSFHGTFQQGRGDVFILVGVCVHQNPREVPVMLSAKLFREKGEKKWRKGDD